MVKQAFADDDLNNKLSLTSANSINVARWLPQQLYYFFAYQQWPHNEPPAISVPSGNFGNICAGITAHVSGLPVTHFIAACNVNDVITRYLQTGNYEPKPAIATISNAMDVGNPSNFVRVMKLFHQQLNEVKNMLSSYTVNDEITRQTIKTVFEKLHYILDPHGAVGYYALNKYLNEHPDNKGFFLETAHPVKFPDTVEEVTNTKIPFPETVQYLLHKEKQSVLMDADFEKLKEWLMDR
jgi:threonine synthase